MNYGDAFLSLVLVLAIWFGAPLIWEMWQAFVDAVLDTEEPSRPDWDRPFSHPWERD